MTNLSVETLLSSRSTRTGRIKELQQKTSGLGALFPGQQPSLGSSPGIDVKISPTASKISLLLQSKSANGTSAAAGFDKFLDSNHQQLKEHGRKAELLRELPDNLDPDRQTLAKQAANYLLVRHYGGEKLYAESSANNPFAGLDRASLSKISFDDSGLLTAAERQAAFLEMTERDLIYRHEIFDLNESLDKKDDSIPWSRVTSHLSDAQLVGSMSEGEKAWRDWPSAQELEAFAASMMRYDASKQPTLPEYDNLDNQDKPILAFIVGKDGSGTWKNISLEELSSDTMPLALVRALVDKATAEKPEHPWLSLYTTISGFNLH